MELNHAIASIRNSVCAVLRIRPLGNNQVNATIIGTAWCIVEDRYLVTAYHIFNERKARKPDDKFFVFSVPDNKDMAYHVPVTSFILEDEDKDMTIIEIDTSSNRNFSIKSVPVTFKDFQDGEKVLTYGFPSPVIQQANVDKNLNWTGGALFLKAHANEGIISGQFPYGEKTLYEFNVGWYQGESGGPIFSIEPLAAFSLMQSYRNVSTPHGVVPGPHQGFSLKEIEQDLVQLGAKIL